jgi:hypothetical protein
MFYVAQEDLGGAGAFNAGADGGGAEGSLAGSV